MSPRQHRPATAFERVVASAGIGAALLSAHSVANWLLLRRPPSPGMDASRRPSVSVLIPARDEALRLGPTLAAVLAQSDDLAEVLVLDDSSADGTADVAAAVAGGDPRFRLLTGGPLPDGWLGKPNACWQLAREATGEVLVFLDADVLLQPGSLAACADLLTSTGVDMVSPYPRQVAEGIAERLVQPLLQWSWLTFLPLRLAERTRRASLTAANGQLLVVRASAYRAAGGHAAVRGDVIEDVGIARVFKRAGFTVAMADGTNLATCQMYDGWAELQEGYTKSLWAAFGTPAGATATMTMLSWLYVLPPIAAVVGAGGRRWRLAVLGTLGFGAGTAGRAFTAAVTGGRPGDAPSHPLSVLALALLTMTSFRRRAQGSLAWKGRPVA